MFETLLVLGAAGFLVMTLLGLSHGHSGGGHGGSGHGHAGHAGSADSPASMSAGHHAHASAQPASLHGHTHAGSGPKAPLTKAAHSGSSVGSSLSRQAKSLALMFISPLDIFSVCLGTGMAGILMKRFLPLGTLLTILAFVVGFLFDIVVTRGLLKFALKFSAQPSEGLEGVVGHNARATTAFGKDGKGVVELVFDGQSSQILATLDPGEQQLGVTVHKGDTLLVLEVDPHRNVCRVSRDLAPTDPPQGDQTQP